MRSLQAVPFHSPSAKPEIIALSGAMDVSVTVTVPPEAVVNVWVAALFGLIVPPKTSVTRTGVGMVGVTGSSSPQAVTAARTMASGTERNIKRDIDLV